MRITVVGPVHPFKGGIAQHTATMVNRLVEHGHDVVVESWNRQYPSRLYPGQLTVEAPEFQMLAPVRRRLSWNRPDSWLRVGRQAGDSDALVVAHVNPIQVPAYRALIAAGRRGRGKTVVVAHNVLPHERSKVDRTLVGSLFGAADRIVTHSEQEAALAAEITGTPVAMAPIAPFMPPGFQFSQPDPGEHRRVLFFGLIRPYKGLDVLLRALAAGPPDLRLRVAGEFWGGRTETDLLIAELGLAGRVEILPGYARADQVPGLFRDVDALVLPYRSATGSQGVWTAFQFGVPAIATSAGRLADDIRSGTDGLVAAPDDVASLAGVLTDFYQPGRPEAMRSAVRPVDPDPYWDRYLGELVDWI